MNKATERIESRKIQQVGKRSYAISLPKHWIKENNLKAQDNLFLQITKNRDITIHSKQTTTQIDSLIVNIENIPNISEFIVFCYEKSISNIKIISKKFDYDTVSKIKETLEYLDGYEITREDHTHIEISFLFKDVDINIKKIILRITYLLILMIESLEKKDYKVLTQTELSIDKLYHLAKKILFDCLRNQNIRTQNEIEHFEDIFYMKDIIKRLENIGDLLYQFKNINKKNIEKLRRYTEFCDQMLNKKENLEQCRTQLEKLKSEKQETYVIHRAYKLCKDIMENMASLEYNKKFFTQE